MQHGTDITEPVPWLMRSWRYAAPDPTLRRQVGMIAAMKTCPGVAPSLTPGTLTRYEHGQLAPPTPVLTALEHVVGLCPGEISSYATGSRAPESTRQQDWDFLARADAADAETLSGGDWLRLARLVTAETPQSPHRVTFWSHLLVSEMSRSIGAAYRLRMHALQLIARDSQARDPVADAVRDHLEACGHTVIGDAIEAMITADHPESAVVALDAYFRLDGAPLQMAADTLTTELHHHKLHPSVWPALRSRLRDDLTSGSPDRCDAATRVAIELPPLRLHELRGLMPQPAATHLRRSFQRAHLHLQPTEHSRDLRQSCERLATSIAGTVTGRGPDGLGYWLTQALISTDAPLRSALVLASSPYADEISHYLERTQNTMTPGLQHPQYPGATLVMSTCQRTDPHSLVRAYQAGTDTDKRRLLVPLAHNRAFTADIDLAGAIRDTGSAPTVIYAAGMSGHPGLRGLHAPGLTTSERTAARWWGDQRDQPDA